MFSDSALQYYSNLHKKIRNNFNKAARSCDEDGVHYLRVEIRRLKSLLDVIKNINGQNNFKKSFHPLRSLFKATGKLRDVHVQIILAKELQTKLNVEFNEYFQYLINLESQEKKRLSRILIKFELSYLKPDTSRIRKLLKKTSHEAAEHESIIIYNEFVNKLIKLKSGVRFDFRKLHEVRIFSKKARYTLEAIYVFFPDLEYKTKAMEILRGIHQVLGKWHDYEVCLDNLKAFKTNVSGVGSYSSRKYNLFVKTSRTEKIALLAQLDSIWKNIDTLSLN